MAGGGGRCGHCQVCEPTILLPGSLCLLALLCCGLDAEDVSPLLLPGSPVVWAPPQSLGRSWILRCWCCWCPSYLLPGCRVGASLPQLLDHYHLCWRCGLTVTAREPGQEVLYPCPSPHSAAQYSPFQMYQCVAFSGAPVRWAEEPLLGYKCPTSRRWKGISKRVVSLCHDSDFTPTAQTYYLTVL